MQDSTRDVRDANPSAAPAATSADSAAETRAAVAPQAASRPMAATQPAARGPRLHLVWLVVGAVALLGLILGVVAIARGVGTETSSAPSGTMIEQTTIDAIRAAGPSVVQVQASGGGAGGGGSGVGAGVILTTSGYIVTNAHMVHGFSSFSVLLANGQQHAAQLVGEAPSDDLAVLKVNASDLHPIAVGNSNHVQVGQYALALGSPAAVEQSATSGIVSALNRRANETVDGRVVSIGGLIQTSAPINPGNNGGALVNMKGQLIGIPTLGAVAPGSGTAADGVGFAISSNRMRAVFRQLTGGAA